MLSFDGVFKQKSYQVGYYNWKEKEPRKYDGKMVTIGGRQFM